MRWALLGLLVGLGVALGFLMGVASAAAIDMTLVLKTAMGEPMKDFDRRTPGDERCEKCPVLTLGHAIAYALLATWKDENIDWRTMRARAKLADKVRDNKAAVITSEEVQMILTSLARAFGPIVIGQAVPILDPNAK